MLNIKESDYVFVRQAIRDRAEMMINQLCPTIDMFAEPDYLPDDQIKVVQIHPAPVKAEVKINAVRDPKAPWGYKKDGTPRARPGRPTKRRVSTKRK